MVGQTAVKAGVQTKEAARVSRQAVGKAAKCPPRLWLRQQPDSVTQQPLGTGLALVMEASPCPNHDAIDGV